MKVEMRLSGLDGVLDTLKSLPPEIVSKRGGPVRAALRKGAVVLHKQALANLQAVVSNQTSADDRHNTGLLQKNLVVTRGKEPVGTKGERFLVRVRNKSYNRKGAKVTTLKTANLLEYGSSKQPAESWLRTAFAAKAETAIKTIEADLIRRVNAIVAKLAQKNKGK